MFFRRRNRRTLRFATVPLERSALIRVLLPFELHANAQQAALRAGATPTKVGKWLVTNQYYSEDGPMVTFELDATRLSDAECEALMLAAEPYARYMSDSSPTSSRVATRPADREG